MAMITLGNPNPQAITLTGQFDHNLPISSGSILVDGTPGIATTCPGTVTAIAGSATISYNSGDTIPAGGCKITVNITGTVPGDYTGVIPAGDLQTNVGPNPAPATADLAISTQGYISGQVWADNDTTPNGTFDSGTDSALSAVTLHLHAGANCAGVASQSTTTDSLGNYLFFRLPQAHIQYANRHSQTARITGSRPQVVLSPSVPVRELRVRPQTQPPRPAKSPILFLGPAAAISAAHQTTILPKSPCRRFQGTCFWT